ncbi:MAG: TRAP transporter large permease subunit [Spirochaetota bacterium]|nr:TRAP transporter large permease subunit [Spirochaetota bacterium]
MGVILVFLAIVFVLLLILIGTPLFGVIGGLTLYFFTSIDLSTNAIITEISKISRAPGIIALPLFTFTGYLLAESKASERMIRLSSAFLSWLPGGMAVVVLVAGSIFTALTGANALAIIAIGGLLLPALIKSGFEEDFSLGLVTTSGSLGLLFVPSLPIIIYALISQVDTVLLFIAGVLPGSLLVLVLIIYSVWHGHKIKIPTERMSISTILGAINESKWEIPLPFVIVIGIFTGIITVGEAAAVSAAYAIITECFIYRDIGFKKLLDVVVDSMVMVGALMCILGLALGLTNYLIDQQIPQAMMEFIQKHISSKLGFLMALNGFLLIAGCMMDIFSAILVLVPLIAPIADGYGIDPVHLGIVFLSNMTIGYLTPPIGMNLFVASVRFQEPIVRLFRVVIPFFILNILVLLVITYWPKLSLLLIDMMGKRPELLTI